MKHIRKGFTLIELAIVLVILTLLTGALMFGFEMVRDAETRAVIAEADRYIVATKTFLDKYNQLPGDFTRAIDMWGEDLTGGGCTGNTYSAATKRETCEGNGDGTIGSCCPIAQSFEWYRAWQHLANAGFVDGSFNGIGGFVAPAQLKGISVPVTSYPGGAYTLMFSVNNTASAEDFAYVARHILQVGQISADIVTGCSVSADPLACVSRAPLFTPEQAATIDSKIDDGQPGTGRIMSRPNTSTVTPNCTTSAVALTSAYDTTRTGQLCSLMIDIGF